MVMLKPSKEETEAAMKHTIRNGLIGSARWASYSAIASTAAYLFSPVYRGLTIQFKVYLFMSGTVMGGYLWADRGMRDFEAEMRRRRRAKAEAERKKLDPDYY